MNNIFIMILKAKCHPYGIEICSGFSPDYVEHGSFTLGIFTWQLGTLPAAADLEGKTDTSDSGREGGRERPRNSCAADRGRAGSGMSRRLGGRRLGLEALLHHSLAVSCHFSSGPPFPFYKLGAASSPKLIT